MKIDMNKVVEKIQTWTIIRGRRVEGIVDVVTSWIRYTRIASGWIAVAVPRTIMSKLAAFHHGNLGVPRGPRC